MHVGGCQRRESRTGAQSPADEGPSPAPARKMQPTAQGTPAVRILMWDGHGGYTDSLVAGTHEYLFLPPDSSGRGGLARYGNAPPRNAHQVTAEDLRDPRPGGVSAPTPRGDATI